MHNNIKKAIKEGIFFILIVIIILLLLNHFYIKDVLEKNIEYQNFQGYAKFISDNIGENVNIVFLGSSHTLYNVDATLIPDSLNIGVSGGSYSISYYKLLSILDKSKNNVKISNIFIEIDQYTFSSASESPEFKNPDNIRLFSEFINLKDLKEIYNLSLFRLMTYIYIPVIGKGNEFIYNLISEKESFGKFPLSEVKGMEDKLTSNASIRREMAIKKYERHFKDKDLINKKNYEFFIRILMLAENNGIKVVLVKYPVTKEYYDVLLENGILIPKFYEQLLDNINSILDKEYTILDYQGIFFNNPEYFADSDHLNVEGANMLTNKIYEDAIKKRFILK